MTYRCERCGFKLPHSEAENGDTLCAACRRLRRAKEMEEAYKLSAEKDKSHFLSRFGSEANPTVSDWLRHWWRSIGGKIHGPRIETAYIPEAHLLREVTALRNEIDMLRAERDAAEAETARIHDLAGKEAAELRAEVERLREAAAIHLRVASAASANEVRLAAENDLLRCALSHIAALVREPGVDPADSAALARAIIDRLPNAEDQRRV